MIYQSQRLSNIFKKILRSEREAIGRNGAKAEMTL